MITKKEKTRIKVKKGLRKKIHGTAEKPRMSVYRSLNDIYVQFIDDDKHHTILAVSSLTKDLKESLASVKGKVAKSKIVGLAAAKLALEKNITTGIFDRNGFKYHGRVKALAEGMREGGLKF